MAEEEKKLTPADFFHQWAVKLDDFKENKGRPPTKKEVIQELKITSKLLKDLLNFFQANYGIEKKSKQTWPDFFHQISQFFIEDNELENKKIELETKQPSKDQLESLIAEKKALEERKQEITEQVRQKIESQLGVNQTEADRLIKRLIYLKQIESLDSETSLLESETEVFNKLEEAANQPEILENFVLQSRAAEEITAQLPSNLRSNIFTSTSVAGKIISRQANKVDSIAKDNNIKLSPRARSRLAALSIIIPQTKEIETEKSPEKEEFQEIMEQLGVEKEQADTILIELEHQREILFRQVPAEKKVETRLKERGIDSKQAKEAAEKVITAKRKLIEKKIDKYLPAADDEIKTKITAHGLSDEYGQIRTITEKMEALPKSEKKEFLEDITLSNDYLAAKETVAHQIRNLSLRSSPTIPESFQDKLDKHPQIADEIAGLVVTRTSQDVAKEKIAQTIIGPTAISFAARGVSIDQGEEESVKQVITGLADTTLKMVALSEEQYYKTSILNDLEKQLETYLGKKITIKRPDGTYKQFDLSEKINAKAIKLMAEFWAQRPSDTGLEFLELKTKGETALSVSLKKLPAGNTEEVFAQFNAEQDPVMAAAIAAQLTETSPDQLVDQIETWQEFTRHLEKSGQAEILQKDKLLSMFESLYGKQGVAEQVYQSRLYRIYQNFKQVISPFTQPITQLMKSKLFRKLGQTVIGKGLKTVWNQGKNFLKQKIFEPIKKWALKKVGEQIAKEGFKLAVKEGVKAAAAAAGATVSFGITAAIWVGEKILKAGYSLFKKGIKAVGLDKAADKFNQLTSFGLAPKLDKAVDKILFFVPAAFRDGIKFFNRIFEGAAEISIISSLIIPAIIAVFIILFFVNLFPLAQTNQTMAPSVIDKASLPIQEEETFLEVENSPYIKVTKSANVSQLENSQLPREITYTITISATTDNLTGLTISNDTVVITEDGSFSIKQDINGQGIEKFDMPSELSPEDSPITINYTISAEPEFKDSRINDTVIIAANVPTQQVENEASQANHVVTIGSPPQGPIVDCPDSGAEIMVSAGGYPVQKILLTRGRPGGCIVPTMIIIHWSGGWSNNDVTRQVLENRNRSCHIGTDQNGSVQQWMQHWEKKAEFGWCAGPNGNPYGVNNEMVGAWFDTNPPPDAEFKSAVNSTCWYMRQYNIPASQIYGHYELQAGKSDPGKDFLQNRFIPAVINQCGT
jgi:hypothetical protein